MNIQIWLVINTWSEVIQRLLRTVPYLVMLTIIVRYKSVKHDIVMFSERYEY